MIEALAGFLPWVMVMFVIAGTAKFLNLHGVFLSIMHEMKAAAALKPTLPAINFFGLAIIGSIMVLALIERALHWIVLVKVTGTTAEDSPIYEDGIIAGFVILLAMVLLISMKLCQSSPRR
jgi:hypothetical protein